MKKYLTYHLDRLLSKEQDISRLSASFCLGTFVALMPVIPLQTPLVVALAWIFGLNVGVSVAALYIVNNPFTMIPIYIFGYAVGHWLFGSILHIDLSPYNPAWVERFNIFISRYIDIKRYLGSDLCFWCLMCGGFIFALCVALPLYPLMKRLFAYAAQRLEKQKDVR